MRFNLTILTAFLFLFAPLQTSAATVVSAETWEPQAGDELFIDVDSNMGYMLRSDSDEFFSFVLATGVRKKINYLGRNYFAATPKGQWVAKARKIQTDRVMFGKTGRFLRLYWGGDTFTNYGIHGYAYFDKWAKSDDRYKTYGCIAVSEDILDLIEQAYFLGEEQMRVTTMAGPEKFLEELTLHEQQGA